MSVGGWGMGRGLWACPVHHVAVWVCMGICVGVGWVDDRWVVCDIGRWVTEQIGLQMDLQHDLVILEHVLRRDMPMAAIQMLGINHMLG